MRLIARGPADGRSGRPRAGWPVGETARDRPSPPSPSPGGRRRPRSPRGGSRTTARGSSESTPAPARAGGAGEEDLEEHVEPAGPVRPGKAEPHQTIHGRRQPAVRPGASTQAKRLAELAGRKLGGDLMSPQLGQPAQQQGRAGPDDCGPALLDVGVRQVEPDLTNPRVWVIDGGEDKITITFHAPVGRETLRFPRRKRRGSVLHICGLPPSRYVLVDRWPRQRPLAFGSGRASSELPGRG